MQEPDVSLKTLTWNENQKYRQQLFISTILTQMYPVISIMFINIYIHVSILYTSNVYSYFVNSFMMVNLL